MGSKEASLVYGYKVSKKLFSYASAIFSYLSSLDAIISQHKDRIFASPYPRENPVDSVLLDTDFIKDESGREVARKYFADGHGRRSAVCIVDASEETLYTAPSHETKCVTSAGSLSSFACNTSGNVLAVAYCNGILAWYDIIASEDSWISLKLIRELKTNSRNVSAIAFDSTGAFTACGTVDGKVLVYQDHSLYHTFRVQQGIVSPLVFHPKRRLLFCGSQGGDLTIYNVDSKSIFTTCQCHMSAITDVTFIPTADESLGGFLSSSRDGIVALWQFGSETVTKPLKQFLQFEPVISISVRASSGGNSQATWTLLVVLESGCIKFLDPLLDKPIAQRPCTLGQGEIRCAAAIDEHIVLLGSCGTLCFYNSNLELVKHLLVNLDGVMLSAYCDCALDLVDNKTDLQIDGKSDEFGDYNYILQWYRRQASKGVPMAFVSCGNEYVRLLAIDNDCDSITLHQNPQHRHTDTVLSLSLCAASRVLASGGKDGVVFLTSLSDLTVVAKIESSGIFIAAMALKHESTRTILLACGDTALKSYELHLNKGKFVHLTQASATAVVHKKPLNAVALSPNGKVGLFVFVLHFQYVATGASDKQIAVYSIDNLIVLGKCTGHRRSVVSVEFMNTTKGLVSCSLDQYIKIWNLTDFTCIKTLEGHLRAAMRALVLPNDLQIISSGMDGLVKVWNIPNSDCISTLDEHYEKVFNIELCGTSLLSISGNGLVIWWSDETDTLRAQKLKDERLEMQRKSQVEALLAQGQTARALCTTLQLNAPYMALDIINRVVYAPQRSLNVAEHGNIFKDWVVDMCKSDNVPRDLEAAIDFCLVYISKAKTCWVANCLLKQLLDTFEPGEWAQVGKIGQKLESLIAHEAAHVTRFLALAEKSHLLDLAANYGGLMSSSKVSMPMGATMNGNVNEPDEENCASHFLYE